ncbi:hypothetical protein C2S51_033266 [Perilla frutescens var. frutescens]|nr:hypothetical protein C2S51_033266 [Perilla frutescens var. frutescens]
MLTHSANTQQVWSASVLIRAWVANKIVEWDHNVERQKRWMEDGDGARKQQIKAPPNC